MTLIRTLHTVPLVIGLLCIQNILLLNKRAYQLNIFLVAIGSVSYLILIQQDHLGVYYKYLEIWVLEITALSDVQLRLNKQIFSHLLS
jgi:hypothetical protein